MPPQIAQDIVLRATIKDDTAKGASSVKNRVRDIVNGPNTIKLDKHGSFGRIFSDQKTTGLGPLGRGLTEGISEKLGTGLKLGVLAVAGKALADLTESAAKFADEMRDGQHNAADLTLEIGKGIPIIGSFVSAGENINEIFTGQKAELEAINSTVESVVHLTDMWASMTRRVKLEQQEYGRALIRDDRAINAIGLRGIDSQRQAIKDKYADQKDANDKAREEAKNAAIDNPELKAAIAAREAFEKKYGGRNLNGALGDQKAALDKRVKDIQAKVAQERDNKLGFLDADDAKKAKQQAAELAEQNALHQEQLDNQRKSQRLENSRIAGAVGVENLETQGFGVSAKRRSIEFAADDAKEEARIEAERNKEATTNAEDRAAIEQNLADKLKNIDAKKNADLAAADKEAALANKRFQFDAAQSQSDAASLEAENAMRAAGSEYGADLDALKHAHEKRNAEIDRQAEEDIARDKEHAADIRAKAEANKRTNDAEFVGQQRQQIMGLLNAAQSQSPLTAIQDAGRTTGIAERFKQNFNPMQPLIELAIKQLGVQERIAKGVEGGHGKPMASGAAKGVFSQSRAS